MPSFGELPEVMHHVEPGTFNLWSFYYDHDVGIFKIGETEHSINDINVQKALVFPSGETLEETKLSTHPVLLNVMSRAVATPKFFDWINNCDYKDVFQNTADVMREVYTNLSDDHVPENNGSPSHINFHAGYEREGHVHLQTFGDCACMGTDPDGIFVDWHEWETGYAEYILHNVDKPAQHISLLAGLGHLATLAAAETV